MSARSPLLRLLGAQTQATGPADVRTVVDPPRPASAPAPAAASAAPVC
ncbi:hypothetical protein [Actinomadura sp. B10D3]